jgi:RecA-family ATPase
VPQIDLAALDEAALIDWYGRADPAEFQNYDREIISRARAGFVNKHYPGDRHPIAIEKLNGARHPVVSEWPAPLDLVELSARQPLTPRHIIPDWLPAGEVTLLAGHGGGGKSQLALYTAVCIHLALSWCGLATERRPVTVVSAEDGADILHWRLSRIAAHLGVSLADLSGLNIIDASHIDAELMREIPHEEPFLTPRYDKLQELVDPSGVLILDGVSDLYGASEIVRRHVRRYIRALRKLVNADGAVLLLAHVDKAAARDGATTDRYSGSTAWHNSVRARWSLGSDDDALVLTLAKANHAKAGAEIRLRWDAQAHLYIPDPVCADGGIAGAIRERQERDGIVAAFRAGTDPVPAATTGQRTAWHVLSARPELPQTLRDGRDGRRRFWAHIEALRAMRIIEEASIPRKTDRHYVRYLRLTEGSGQCGQS